MSLLSIVQSVALRVNIAEPSLVINSSDPTTKALLHFAQEEGKELAARGHWTALTKEATFSTVDSQNNYDLDTVASDYSYHLNDTLFNRDSTWKVNGPMSPQEWQEVQAATFTGIFPKFRIRGGEILISPTPTAVETVAFEYLSKNWCKTAGDVEQSAWANDTDVGILDEEIMSLGIIWRWKEMKGFIYAEDFAKYERRVEQALARDGGRPVLNMGNAPATARGIRIPDGSWVL